jgi:hypothetical protein
MTTPLAATPFGAVPPVITEDTVRQLAQRLMDMEVRLGTQEASLNASRADNQRLSDAAQQARAAFWVCIIGLIWPS